ncbi:hypothetical protein TNCV_347861 [Trichonephila clavipes]|nr:hypothetical protein TNCV_347861 [Trichonephila clavipes]
MTLSKNDWKLKTTLFETISFETSFETLSLIAMSFETSLYLFVDSFYRTPIPNLPLRTQRTTRFTRLLFYPKLAFMLQKGRGCIPPFLYPTLYLGSKRDVPTTHVTFPFSPVFIPQRCLQGLDSRLKQSMQKRTLNDTKFFQHKKIFQDREKPQRDEGSNEMLDRSNKIGVKSNVLVRGPSHSNVGDDSQVI